MDTSAPAASADRWDRHDWWGVVLDAPDVAVLARFYAELRGWAIHHLDDDDASLDAGEGVAYLNIQRRTYEFCSTRRTTPSACTPGEAGLSDRSSEAACSSLDQGPDFLDLARLKLWVTSGIRTSVAHLLFAA